MIRVAIRNVKTIVEKYLNPHIKQRQLSDTKVHAPVSPYLLSVVSILLHIASVSGQDSPIILDTPQPEYRVSSPTVHPEDESPQ